MLPDPSKDFSLCEPAGNALCFSVHLSSCEPQTGGARAGRHLKTRDGTNERFETLDTERDGNNNKAPENQASGSSRLQVFCPGTSLGTKSSIIYLLTG